MAGADGDELRADLHEVLGAVVDDVSEHDAGFHMSKNLQSLQALYDGDANCYLHALQLALVGPLKHDGRGRSSQDIERLLRIVSAVSYAPGDFARFVRFALRGCEAEDRNVRFHCTQLTGHLLGHATDISDELWEDVAKIILQRAKDKFPTIRAASVVALQLLQTLSVDDVEAISTAVLRLAVTDPSKEVRVAATEKVAVLNTSIGDLLIRVRDVSPDVRATVFKVLATVDTAAILSPSDRVHMLDQGMNDRDESVVSACQDMVLAWLRRVNGSPVELLSQLTIEKAPAVCSLLCRWLLKTHATDLSTPNIKDKALFGSALSVADAFFWKEQCQYYQSIKHDEMLELLLPTISSYCDLLRHLHTSLADAVDEAEKDQVLVVGQYVLQLGVALDFQDEVGRRQLIHLLRTFFQSIAFESKWLHDAVMLLAMICRSTEFEFVQYMTEITSDLYDQMQEMDSMSLETRTELTERLDAVDAQLEDESLSPQAYDALSAEALALEKQLEEPKTLQWLRCLELTAKLLQFTRQNLRNATIAGVLHMILPAIDSDIPALREKGLEGLGLYCLLDRHMAAKHAIVFWRVLNADDEDGDSKHVCIQVLLDFFTAFKQFEVLPVVEDDEVVTSRVILDGLATYFCVDQRELDEWDLPTQTLVVRGFIKLFLLGRIQDLETLQHLLELYFHPFLKEMVISDEHGFCSETLQMLTVFYHAADCALISSASHHVLSRALYGVSSVPFAEAAPYLLQLLQHPRRDGSCDINHHNKVAIWVCVEMLALHEVTNVIARAAKKQFLHQWWTLLQNLEWSVDAPANDDETEDDDDAPIARSRKRDDVKVEAGVSAHDAPPTDDAPLTDDVLLYILLDEVCTLVPENAKLKAKMAAAFGESFKCELTDAIQTWMVNAVGTRKDVLSKGVYKRGMQYRAAPKREANDSVTEEEELGSDAIESDESDGESRKSRKTRTKASAAPTRATTARQSKSAAAAKLKASISSDEASAIEIEDDSSAIEIEDDEDDEEEETKDAEEKKTPIKMEATDDGDENASMGDDDDDASMSDNE